LKNNWRKLWSFRNRYAKIQAYKILELNIRVNLNSLSKGEYLLANDNRELMMVEIQC